MIFLLLADGFEETEALCTLDLIRRAELDIITVGIGKKEITGSHNITVICDKTEDEISDIESLTAVILPGGMPGTLNLEKSEFVNELIDFCYNNNVLLAAICAAPSILGRKGFLENKKAVCYPGFEKLLKNAEVLYESVIKDGNIITSRGAGTTIPFALKIIEELKGSASANKVKDSIICTI